jgi:hypothetical protein
LDATGTDAAGIAARKVTLTTPRRESTQGSILPDDASRKTRRSGNRLFTDRPNNARGTAEIHEFHRKLLFGSIREVSMPRVLVVDDQADVRTIISIVLRINQF